MKTTLIICPKCKTEIPVEEALSAAFRDKIEKEAKDQANVELKLLEEELQKRDKKLQESREIELNLRKQKTELEEEKRSFELEKQRQIDAERDKIRAQTLNEATESFHLKEKEYEKKLADMKAAVDEAQRKGNQGSQQLQGEVQELDLEETLKKTFVYDTITPVGKGIHGADIQQIVKTNIGNICGTILWESKRTKAWNDDWLTKLKDDLRATKANVPVIISSVLPKEITSGLGLVEGVWVVNYQLFLPLAELLRQRLIGVAREKFVSQDRGNKADSLYQYVVSHEFIQQVEALLEVYQELAEQTTKEKNYYERLWKTREAQSQRLFKTTANIVGSIQGQIGRALPVIKGIDLPELDSGDGD